MAHANKPHEKAAKEYFEARKHQQLAPEEFLNKDQLARVHRAIHFTHTFRQAEADAIAKSEE